VLEDQQPEHVHREPQRAHDQHQRRVIDGLRHGEPLQRLHGHGEAERGEEHGVSQRAHHLRAAHAVREAPRARATRHPRRRQPDAQRQNVRQHVEGVRHQRDGVAHVPRHDLRHEEDDGDDQHQDQAALINLNVRTFNIKWVR
uniref:Uncharacterized protein n=1 Tax=Sinocyclocheilus grahami TaxID=75366 RepID=A0A672P052_SINGR